MPLAELPAGLMLNPAPDRLEVACASVWPITLGTVRGDDDDGAGGADGDGDVGVGVDADVDAGAGVIAGEADDDAGAPPGYMPEPPVMAPWSRMD